MKTETETKHTPGPWHAGTMNETGQAIFPESGGFNICILSPVRDYNQEANANLIAAAPELLEACKTGARMLLRNTLQDSEDTEIYKQMKKAVSIAEGRAS